MRLFAALFLLGAVGPLYAQTATATLSGTVTDSSGAIVPGVEIKAVHTATKFEQKAVTNSSGVFTIPLLPPGTYTVSAAHTGFAPVELNNVVLQVAQRLALDIVLKVGAMTDSVTVAADAGQMQLKTESGDRSEVITFTQVRDLAMNGRNTLDLMKTVPGIVSALNGQLSQVSGLNTFTINGTRATEKQFLIDGSSNLKGGANNAAHVTMNPDAIAEVKVLTSNFQAEYGKAAGGIIQYTTRAGTSAFHADARYFRRHDSMNANNFFNNLKGLPRPIYRYNYYGYDVGGPVLLPHTNFNHDRNKLFFFFNQEIYQQPIINPAQTVRMPTALERGGDFSQTRDGNGNPIVIRDPQSGAPFPGNIVPRNRFFSDGQKILNIYPAPNDTTGGLVYNYSSQISGEMPRREYILRVDYNISDRTRFSGRMIANTEDREEPYGGNSFNVQTNFPLSTVGSPYNPWNFAFSLINTISPTMTNEFIFGPSLSPVSGKWSDNRAFRSTYGITFPLFYPNAKGSDIIPTFQYGGIANQPFPSAALRPLIGTNTQTVYNFTDNVMKVAGKHTFKAGIYVQSSLQDTTAGANPHSIINFNNDANNPLNTGHPFANALMGIYTQYTQSSDFIPIAVRYINVETYVQDTWKVTRRFTLDYGLRVSWIPPQYETSGKSSLFVPSMYNPAKAVRLYAPILVGNQRRAVDPANIPATPTTANTLPTAQIGFVVPGSGDVNNGIALGSQYLQGGFQSRGAQWGPRFGFAWDVTGNGNTVIRGGYGISYDRVQGNVILAQTGNPPILQNPTLFYGYLADLSSGAGLNTPGNIVGYAPAGKIPNVHSMSLGVQRNIGYGTVLDVAYVGTLSRHNVQQININSDPYFNTFGRAAQDPSQYPNGDVPAVEPGLPAIYANAGFNFSGARALPVNFLRPYPGYGNINLRDFSGSSNYHSLQIAANRKLSRGLTFGLAYTWSKSLETGDTDFENNNPYNTRAYDYRLSNFDRTHTVVINYVYSLPKGSRLVGTGGNKVMRGILDNWQVSGITQYYSGAPNELGLNIQGVNSGERILGTYSTSPLPYRVGGAPATTPNVLVNPAAYYAPGIGDIGPYPRTYLRGPGFLNHDISVFKNFPLRGEGRYLQFRVEMFNAFNNTEFSGINSATQLTTANGATGANIFTSGYPAVSITNNVRPAGSTALLGQYFGEYNGARDPRIIQLAVKIYF